MNLSGRSSLSGRPEFLQPAVAVKAPAVPVGPRICCACKQADIVQIVDDAPHHSVTLELRWIGALNEAQARQKISGYLAQRGWRYKFHLGKHAMERDICRECLMRHREIEREFKRKKSNELKSSSNSESYYMALCGD